MPAASSIATSSLATCAAHSRWPSHNPRLRARILRAGSRSGSRERRPRSRAACCSSARRGTCRRAAARPARGRTIGPLRRRRDPVRAGHLPPAVHGGQRVCAGREDPDVRPDPPSTYNREVSTEFDRIVLKALEPSPEFRYQRAEDFAVDLRQLGRTGANAGKANRFRSFGKHVAVLVAVCAAIVGSLWVLRVKATGRRVPATRLGPRD